MDSITQKAKFRLSAIKFAKSHGVTKASREFSVSRQTIYLWQKHYDGTEESLKPKSRRPHHHPAEHSQEEIALIKEMREKYPHDGLNMFWYRLCCMDYTRSMSALFRVMRRLVYTEPNCKIPSMFPNLTSQHFFRDIFLSKFAKCKRTTASSLLGSVHTKESTISTKRIKPAKRTSNLS